ncbi:MAG: hypothetical protein A2821_03270 [Candidatus Magasanikbacteria bacterium RIFCSPHIGHO2_01_FULL_41_23]|uniref:Uncharacterized protein n=1 Tax=Candidatus Magasanikbacteria bacterium RIFCSPLOWO2_01_FULL_40_15 TaxID=1798686 RepID=A0A1F6N255_9BACT|nr:MAG: hypothetical protein A2821_03270 [Candidatus Magasanikbacteria bacterium RIFCSPHIGHO2_01_FULL_41_23]OGH76475.1 MAG: hypothetical protein A3F22_03260 [Candidatus Magasanikbacteria bacterium RIFCSPHIGHO2_12_FULL_41_16]OGH77961.1 MAG: hypothetical protein A2983_01295 [Candidatus Magasanikbacteria bacterium RIFCSPLOWO2_01_FULL_40_15]
MSFIKKMKDTAIKFLLGNSAVPRGLFELQQYFSHNEPINFRHEKGDDGKIIAISINFRHGSIVTTGKNQEELDSNIKDAILTSFDVPSSYAIEAGLQRVGESRGEYATT